MYTYTYGNVNVKGSSTDNICNTGSRNRELSVQNNWKFKKKSLNFGGFIKKVI